jgi:transcription elongation factor GreA
MTKKWPEIFSRLFYAAPNKFIIDELTTRGKLEVIKDLFQSTLDQYRDAREPFVWLVRNVFDEPWFAGFEIPYEKILIGMIHLLDLTYRDIENRRSVSANRRLNKQIQDFLFKEERLLNFLMITDQDSITRLYTLVEDIKDLDPSIKINLKQRIKEKYPDFKFIGQVIEAETVSGRMLVTRSGYESKQKELRHLLEVEVPENSRDIGVAMAKGDLRENAEYKAALEKQGMLNSAAARLQQELQSAQIVDPNDVTTDQVSFGTRVTLTNLDAEKPEEFTILGPWESNPTQRIISYLSPLGTKIYNSKRGEELHFKINEKEFHYRVENIENVAELL